MEYDKNICPVVEVNGSIACGKQFDIDINLPEDNRNVIFGVIVDCCKEPVCDAVVKLIEISCECGREERKPVSHTFTDKNGEFVFGPLCPNRLYAIDIWVNRVKHAKICSTCDERSKVCLKGVKLDCPCDISHGCKKHCEKHCDCEHQECNKPCEKHCDCEHQECNKPCEKHCDCEHQECNKPCEKHCDCEHQGCNKPCERPCNFGNQGCNRPCNFRS